MRQFYADLLAKRLEARKIQQALETTTTTTTEAPTTTTTTEAPVSVFSHPSLAEKKQKFMRFLNRRQ